MARYKKKTSVKDEETKKPKETKKKKIKVEDKVTKDETAVKSNKDAIQDETEKKGKFWHASPPI